MQGRKEKAFKKDKKYCFSVDVLDINNSVDELVIQRTL